MRLKTAVATTALAAVVAGCAGFYVGRTQTEPKAPTERRDPVETETPPDGCPAQITFFVANNNNS